MEEKILEFYYLNMTSFKCSQLLFKHKRILRTVFSMTFSKNIWIYCVLFFDDVAFKLMESIRHIDVK